MDYNINKTIRYIFSLTLVVLVTVGCSTEAQARKRKRGKRSLPRIERVKKQEVAKQDVITSIEEEGLGSMISSVISRGEELLGRRYRTRGVAPWPLDCSGYVSYLYSLVGVSIPRSSAQLSQYVQKVNDPQPGDLVFFKGRNARSGRVGHVALVVENNDGDLVIMHSTTSRGIIKHRLGSDGYFSKRYLHAGRIPKLTALFRKALSQQGATEANGTIEE